MRPQARRTDGQGPVGANGTRPMLPCSWASRVAAEAAGTPTPATAAGGGGRAGAAAAPPGADQLDQRAPAPETPRMQPTPGGADAMACDGGGAEDGWCTVAARRGRFRGAAGATGGTSSATTPAGAAAERHKEDEAEAHETSSLAERWGRDEEYAEEDEEGRDEEEVDDRPAHQRLWDELQVHRADLKRIKRQWPDGHWAVVAAREKVDIAETAWRNEKPTPQPSRALQRAEQAVRRAAARAEDIEKKIDKLNAEYARKKEELEAALVEEEAKLQECREALACAQEEVGAEGRRQRHGAEHEPGAGAVRAAVAVMEEEVAPQLAALLEGLEASGVEEAVKQNAQGLYAKLHSVHSELHNLATAAETAHGRCDQGWQRSNWWHGHSGHDRRSFDIGDDDSLPDLSNEDWEGWHGWQHQYQAQYTYGWGGYDGWGGHGQGHWQAHRAQRHEANGPADECEEPPNKKGKAGPAAMEEQRYEDMQVPAHLTAGTGGGTAGEADAATAAGAAAEEADAGHAAGGEAQRTALQARVQDFQAKANAKGVDVSDVDFSTITAQQLSLLATTRLG